jgi:hypothetical protein
MPGSDVLKHLVDRRALVRVRAMTRDPTRLHSQISAAMEWA